MSEPDPAQMAAHVDAVAAVHAGELPVLRQLLSAHPDLARARLPHLGGRTLLHVATDWPGHFPRVAETITALIQAGADPNSSSGGAHPETPLHWAASSNDIAAIDALLDGGADVNARGAVIAGGTPLADATAFGQWAAARRLVERGATANLWEAAALGLLARVDEILAGDPTNEEALTQAFWGACHGGQRETAARLLVAGADLNWVGWDDLSPLDAARRSGAHTLASWLQSQGAVSAAPGSG